MKITAALADLFKPRHAPAFGLSDSNLTNPEPWLLEAMGSTPTMTGEVLTKRGAEAIPAVWACKHRLEADVGKLPLDVFERTANNGRRKARESRLHFLLRRRPNPEQGPMAFLRMLMFHRLSYGDAYVEIERAGGSRGTEEEIRSRPVVALWPLLSDRTRAMRHEGQKILLTRVREKRDDGSMGPPQPKALFPGEYIHVPGRGFDGLRSYSAIELGANTLGLAKSQIDWAASFYDGDAMAGAWVTVPSLGAAGRATKDKQDIIRDAIREQVGGLRRAHRLGILWEGAQIQNSVVTPREQELVAGMNLSGLEICRLMDMKPHKVAYLENATFSNITEENLAYVGDCIMPHTEQISEAFEWELIGDDPSMFLEWNFKALLKTTPKEEAETLKLGVVTGWISRAEARQITNMNPAPEDQGLDQFLAQVNQITSKSLAGMVEAAGSEDRAREIFRASVGVVDKDERRAAARSAASRNRLRLAWVPVFRRAAERYVSVEVRTARRALDKAGDDLVELNKILTRFWDDFPEAIRRELEPVMVGFGAVVADAIAEEIDAQVAGPVYDNAIAAVTAAAIARHINKSRAGVAGVIADHPSLAEARDALGARFDKWLEVRPGKIADSESVRTGARLAQEAYQAGGIRDKVWVAFGDNCPLCAELNGQVVGIAGSFIEKGGKVDSQQEGTEPMIVDRDIRTPPLHSGCTCGIAGG